MVKRLRTEFGFSQQEVADLMVQAGFSWRQSTVAKTEAAERPVPAEEIAALADMFGMGVASLFPSQDEPTALTRAWQELARARALEQDALNRQTSAQAAAQAEVDACAQRTKEAKDRHEQLAAQQEQQEGNDDGKHR